MHIFCALLVSGAKTVGRPMFQRLHSVPVKTQSKSDIPRSFSHPGALNDIGKFNKLKGTLNVKADFKRPGTKKHTKKGIYSMFLFQILISYFFFKYAQFFLNI